MATQIKREWQMDIVKLEKAFATLKYKLKKNPTNASIAQFDAARIELNLALTAKTKKHIRWIGATLYSQKDKNGSMLASKLSPWYLVHTLLKIRLAGQPPTANPNIHLGTSHTPSFKLG